MTIKDNIVIGVELDYQYYIGRSCETCNSLELCYTLEIYMTDIHGIYDNRKHTGTGKGSHCVHRLHFTTVTDKEYLRRQARQQRVCTGGWGW